MKRFLSVVLVALMALSFAACGSGSASGANIEGKLSDIMTKVLDGADVDSDTKTYVHQRLGFTEINADNEEYYLGKTGYSYKEGYAAEPLISAQAFSIVLLRADNAADAETLAKDIKSTVNPNKWVCVGVDASNVQTATKGDLVILVMAENSQKYIDSFNALS